MIRMLVAGSLPWKARSSLALALLIGLAGSFALAAASGARRTASSYDRFIADYPGADVFLPNPSFGPDFGAVVLDPAEVAAMDHVLAMSVGRATQSQWGVGFAAADARFGFETPRWKILEGRAYDPARVDEAVAVYAPGNELRVGDVISYPGVSPAEAPEHCRGVGSGPQVDVRIVGIAVMAGPFFAQVGDEPWSLLLTPEMHDRLPGLIAATGCEDLAFPPTPGMMWVRTEPGQTEAFLAALSKENPAGFVINEPHAAADQRNEDSIRLQASALWILAAAVALTGLLVISQTIARLIHQEEDDNEPLVALGVTRIQLLWVRVLRVGVPALAGGAIAVGSAFALSPLTPLGAGRAAEPSPGASFDVFILPLGAAIVVALALAVAFPPAWRSARIRRATPATRSRPSIASRLARAGLSPPLVVGVRMAFEPGRARTSVPVRSSIAGVALGLGMVVATFVFDASAQHLLSEPRAYGLTVDVWINKDPVGYPFEEHVQAVLDDPNVVGAALGSPGGALQIDGRAVETMDFLPIKGDVQPRVLEGAYPRLDDEIALGVRTASRLGKGVGDTVTAAIADDGSVASRRVMRVVGLSEIPTIDRAGLGEGAIVAASPFAALTGASDGADGVFVAFASGVDLEVALTELKDALGDPDLSHFGFPPPSDVVDFGRVSNLPLVLAGIVGLIAAAALAHLLITASRRRRRDLAILTTLGFVRPQAHRAIAWQAVATATAGLVIGLPLGVVVGQWSWALLVGGLGLSPRPVVPLGTVGIIVPAMLLFAIAVAVLPARAASRMRPAEVLRVE